MRMEHVLKNICIKTNRKINYIQGGTTLQHFFNKMFCLIWPQKNNTKPVNKRNDCEFCRLRSVQILNRNFPILNSGGSLVGNPKERTVIYGV